MRRPAGQSFVVEWFRPPLWGRLLLAWLVATGLLGVGVVGIALAWDGTGRIPQAGQWVAGAVGGACTVLGATGGIFGIMRMLQQDDRYLLVRGDGLVVAGDADDARFVPWRALGAIRLDGDRLVLERTDGEAVSMPARFMGTRPDALVERLNRYRRDALLGVLKPPRRNRRPVAPEDG